MGLNPRGLSPRQPKVKMTTAPAASLKALGGGIVQFTVKMDKDAGSSATNPDCTGLAVYYKFIVPGGGIKPTPVPPPTPPPAFMGEAGAELADNQGENGLPTPTGYELYVSTKASFSQQMDLLPYFEQIVKAH
jgi:hypothetical protein